MPESWRRNHRGMSERCRIAIDGITKGCRKAGDEESELERSGSRGGSRRVRSHNLTREKGLNRIAIWVRGDQSIDNTNQSTDAFQFGLIGLIDIFNFEIEIESNK